MRPVGEALSDWWGVSADAPAGGDHRTLEALHMIDGAHRIASHAAGRPGAGTDWDNVIWRLRDAANLLRHGNRAGRP
jgi:hypothetical protein